jgi:hypothetical protein
MKYAVGQGVRIATNGRIFKQGDQIVDGDLPDPMIAQLLDAGSIFKDEPEPKRKHREGQE